MKVESWWDTPQWHEYERAYGDEPGTRARLLETAEFSTRVVRLTAPEQMWCDVRKSYRSLINRFLREHWIQTASKEIAAARGLHAAEAGRETRPADTWALMATWLEERRGRMVAAFDDDGAMVAFAYFIVHGAWSYYGFAAASVPDAGISLVWTGLKALRRMGVEVCELGWQGAATTGKERGIEFVRRGFGGRDVAARLSGRPAGWEVE